MTRVRDILAVKGRDVWSIGPNVSVYDAMKLMADKGIGALLVMEGRNWWESSRNATMPEKSFCRAVRREPPRSKKS